MIVRVPQLVQASAQPISKTIRGLAIFDRILHRTAYPFCQDLGQHWRAFLQYRAYECSERYG